MSDFFEIEQRDPEAFRQETRKSTWILIAIFAVLGMGLSTLSVSYFGTPDGNNFVWNVAGVFAGFALTTIIFKTILWKHPIMEASAYSWKLKRSLMKVTNIMHHVEAGVEQDNVTAIQLLRFYHLALTQMHKLEGNDSGISELQKPMQKLMTKIESLGLDPEQTRLDPEWIEVVKKLGKT